MKQSAKNLLIPELKDELQDLTGKINRLRLYLDNPHPQEDSPDFEEEYWLMEGQFRAMLTYQAYLNERLMYLKGFINEEK